MFQTETSAFRYNSLLFKCSLLSAVVTCLVAVVLTVMSISSARDMVTAGARGLVPQIADRVAAQLAGSIRFEKLDSIEGEIQNLVADADGYIEFAAVYDQDGAEIARVGSVGTDTFQASQVRASEVLASGQSATSENGLSIAVPVKFGSNGDTVGAIVLQVTLAPSETLLLQEKIRSTAVALGLILFAAAITVSILRRMIIDPLRDIGGGLSHIADGDYETEIKSAGRNDEIGQIAMALDACRLRLAEARQELVEGAFKGAGFQNSSTPLAMFDNDRRLTHANSAFEHFAERVGLTAGPQDGDAGSVSFDDLGLADLSPDIQELEATLTQSQSYPVSVELPVGKFHISLTIDRVHSAQGEALGTVIEWRDVTETRLANAILKSLDQYQVRAVFAPDGKYINSNAEFELVTDMQDADTSSLNLRELLRDLTTASGQSRSVEEIMAGETDTFGLLKIQTRSGRPAYLQGGTCPVFDGSGRVMAYVVLGGDVTQAHIDIAQAETSRSETQNAQISMINAIRDGLAQVSSGDLKIRLDEPFPDGYDQLREDFNNTVGTLEDVLATVSNQSSMIQREVKTYSAEGENLATRTEQQAATLEETAAALSEITSGVFEAVEGARRANGVVSEARQNAQASGAIVEDAVNAMGKISESSMKISKIISVIDDIAFQTNLLALNAGVEAARAGDAGRGFAVVASEVRALAQRSSNAAQEIGTLISTSTEQVEAGVTYVGNAGSALKDFVSSVGHISDHVSSIASSTQDQSDRLAEINLAMTQLDTMTQQNAAMFQQTTATSQALIQASDALDKGMRHFKVHARRSEDIEAGPPITEKIAPQSRNAIVGAAALADYKFEFDTLEETVAPTPDWEEF